MALINLVLVLSVLLSMAHLLAEKVWQSTRQTANANHREQVFWAAQAGIETARQLLSDRYSGSGGWRTFLANGPANSYPSVPVWVTQLNGVEVELYLRDNHDGDEDVSRDNDLKIYVLARARGRKGTEAMVESLCGFYVPGNEGDDRPDVSVSELADQALVTYGISD
jgi:Tfp pilus assembly protein PilV